MRKAVLGSCHVTGGIGWICSYLFIGLFSDVAANSLPRSGAVALRSMERLLFHPGVLMLQPSCAAEHRIAAGGPGRHSASRNAERCCAIAVPLLSTQGLYGHNRMQAWRVFCCAPNVRLRWGLSISDPQCHVCMAKLPSAPRVGEKQNLHPAEVLLRSPATGTHDAELQHSISSSFHSHIPPAPMEVVLPIAVGGLEGNQSWLEHRQMAGVGRGESLSHRIIIELLRLEKKTEITASNHQPNTTRLCASNRRRVGIEKGLYRPSPPTPRHKQGHPQLHHFPLHPTTISPQ